MIKRSQERFESMKEALIDMAWLLAFPTVGLGIMWLFADAAMKNGKGF